MAWIKIGTQTTDQNGNASFGNLPFGNYRIAQSSATTGYTADTTPQDITISSTTPVVANTTNTPTAVGALKTVKFSEGYPAWTLPGGQFKLMDSTGKTILSQSAPTDANGELTFSNLMTIPGTPQSYKIVEVVAPTGYTLNAQEYTTEITVNTTAETDVPNTPTTSGSVKVDLTDTNYVEYGLTGSDYDIYVEV